MKEFDIEKIGKKMPYKAPSAEFFENFNKEMSSRVAQESKKPQRSISIRFVIPILTAAASLLIGLFIIDRGDYKIPSNEVGYLISDNLDASIDSYFNSLSDDELAYLLNNTSSQDDFYLTLPENE